MYRTKIYLNRKLASSSSFLSLLPMVGADSSVLAGSWLGHTDAVWGLAYSGIKNRLLSCSADGTVKLWNPAEKNPCISTFNANLGQSWLAHHHHLAGCAVSQSACVFVLRQRTASPRRWTSTVVTPPTWWRRSTAEMW